MIRRLKASGLLSFGDPGIDIRPGPLAVLIGPNGAGKTNVLRLLELLRLIGQRSVRNLQGRPTVPEWKHEPSATADRPRLTVEIDGQADGVTVVHEMTFEDANGLLEVADEKYTTRSSAGHEFGAHEAAVAAVQESYRRIRFSPAEMIDERAVVLDLLQNGDEGHLETAAAVAANADERLDGGNDDALEHLYRAMTKQKAGERLSGGAMRFVRRALEFGCGHGIIAAIEHPETGCHPDLVSRLAKAAVDASQNGQFFVTTHSTMFVDAMSEHADAVLVCERVGDHSIVEPLHLPHVNALLADEGLGSIWSRGELGGNRW